MLSRAFPEGPFESDGSIDTNADTGLGADTDTGWGDPGGEEGGEGGDDTEPPEDTGGGGADTGQAPTPSGDQACYPGQYEDWTACVDVVEWSSSWGSDYDYPDPYGGSSQYLKPARFIDLSVADPDFPLAPNFVLDEFMQEWKGRYGLFQARTVERMQQIRDAVGGAVYITSGYRNVSYNASVGGVSSSRHMYGDGVDFYSNSASLTELESICYSVDAGYVGLYTSHIHCDWRYDALDSSFYDPAMAYIEPPAPDHAAVLIAGEVWTAPATHFDEGEPLRQWTALDADGFEIDYAEGDWYAPPADAAFVEVRVGGRVTLREPVD